MKGEHETEGDPTQGEAVAPQPGPGSRLAKARAAANLSVEQVATSLNLTVGVVEALEGDDPERLPAPVFVRGYLKNYARLVGLRGDDLVSQYESTRTPDVPLELRPRPASASAEAPRGLSLRAVVTVLLVAGIGLGAWWWVESGGIQLGSGPVNPAPAPIVQPATPAPDPGAAASASLPPKEPAPSQETAMAPPMEATAPPAAESVAVTPAATAPEAPVVEATPEPPPPPVPTGHKLALALSDDVWVEVVDDDGSRLVFDMLRAGTRREVTGDGPFLVLLGKAGAVRVELDGRSVDHSAFENKGIARFVLDDQDGEIVTRAP